MGWPASGVPLVVPRAGSSSCDAIDTAVNEARIVVAPLPEQQLCAEFGVTVSRGREAPPSVVCPAAGVFHSGLRAALTRLLFGSKQGSCRRLRTLHSALVFSGQNGAPVLSDAHGDAVWWWLPAGRGGVLFIGTDIAGDLVRYRQGDPAMVNQAQQNELWGYAGERPNYLFEEQRAREQRHIRHADEWAFFLTQFLTQRAGVKLVDVLPGGAPGAVILTGDDDQASLDCYQAQLALIGDAPITYFLHPKTRHTRETLRTMLGQPGIDLGLHPDALDAPDHYGDLFAEQVAWFNRFIGSPPRSVRNHGFLNDGYWRHLTAWLDAGVEISSNLPGVDGNVLNGSLLPARVAFGNSLTRHWSLLTAIGDGTIFVNNWSDEQAAACVHEVASRIRESGIPGVIVLNLHPENAHRARAMHRAAVEVIRSGFHPWTMRECLEWFERRDGSVPSQEACG